MKKKPNEISFALGVLILIGMISAMHSAQACSINGDERFSSSFIEWDTNRDGVISKEEFTAAQEKLRPCSKSNYETSETEPNPEREVGWGLNDYQRHYACDLNGRGPNAYQRMYGGGNPEEAGNMEEFQTILCRR